MHKKYTLILGLIGLSCSLNTLSMQLLAQKLFFPKQQKCGPEQQEKEIQLKNTLDTSVFVAFKNVRTQEPGKKVTDIRSFIATFESKASSHKFVLSPDGKNLKEFKGKKVLFYTEASFLRLLAGACRTDIAVSELPESDKRGVLHIILDEKGFPQLERGK